MLKIEEVAVVYLPAIGLPMKYTTNTHKTDLIVVAENNSETKKTPTSSMTGRPDIVVYTPNFCPTRKKLNLNSDLKQLQQHFDAVTAWLFFFSLQKAGQTHF